MKQRYIFSGSLLLLRLPAGGMGAARSRQSRRHPLCRPAITVEKLTRSTFHDAFPTGGTFGVLGYCVPYQRGK